MSNPRKRHRLRLYAEASHRAATVKDWSAGMRRYILTAKRGMSNPRKRRQLRLYAEASHRAATVKDWRAGIRSYILTSETAAGDE
jgi:hypothetical protein